MSDQDKKAAPASEENKDVNLDEKKNDSTKDDVNAAGDKEKKDAEKDPAYLNQKKRAELAEKERDEAKARTAELEAALEAKTDSAGEITDADLEKIAEEEGVSVDFIKKFAGSLEAKLSKATEKLVSSKLSEKEKEDQKKSILTDFKTSFDKVASDWEGSTLSETAVRMHYLTEKAKNSEHTVADSIEEIYGSFKTGKATVEDDPRGADKVGESIDFATVSKDAEKLDKVLKDPKARKEYYKWRDAQGM